MSGDTLGVVLALLVQTGVIAYWGGRISKAVERHEKEIENLRARWHDGLAVLFQRGVTVLEDLADFLAHREKAR